MENRVARWGGIVGLVLACWGAGVAVGQGREGEAEPASLIQDGFEGPKTVWRREETDAPS